MNSQHNQLQANIVRLDFNTRKWYPSVISYEAVSHNGCLLIWDDKKGEQVEYRPCEIGTAEHCKAFCERYN